MSINDNDAVQQPTGGNNQQSTAGGYAGGYGSAAAQPDPQVNGLVQINEILRRSGSVDGTESRSADALKALRESSEKAVASQTLDKEHELFRFDRDANRVGLPSILVVKFVKKEGQTFGVVRTLILDTDAVRLKARTFQYGADRVEVPVLPQHVFNDTYWSRITDFLRTQRGITSLQAADAGPLVVPKDFDFKDESKVTKLLVTSVNRCDDIIAKLIGERPFSVATVKRADEFFTSRLDLNSVPTYDLLGNPIRSDLTISMGRSSKTVQDNNDFYDADTTFNSLSCFVNLEFTPQPQGPQGAWNNQPQATQFLTPTVVITGVKQADWITANTPELYLLALSNGYRVTANTQWARAFLPAVGKKKDLRDIGAIGFLMGQNGQAGSKIKTKGETFTENDFVQLMQVAIKPLPSFLIDINPVGDNAAIEGLFLEAAGNGPNKARAVESIVKAANNLTNNAFSRHFNHLEVPIVVPANVDVNLGYYLDEHNEKRDRRDLGTLEMLNATDGDINAWTSWYRTMCDANVPTEIRMKQREGFEQLYLGNTAVKTGVATRLVLTGKFIEALDKATIEAGVAVNFENVSTVFGTTRFQGNDLVGQYSVGGSAQVNYGGQTTQAGYGVGGATNSGRIY